MQRADSTLNPDSADTGFSTVCWRGGGGHATRILYTASTNYYTILTNGYGYPVARCIPWSLLYSFAVRRPELAGRARLSCGCTE